jgi:hypothetical protein
MAFYGQTSGQHWCWELETRSRIVPAYSCAGAPYLTDSQHKGIQNPPMSVAGVRLDLVFLAPCMILGSHVSVVKHSSLVGLSFQSEPMDELAPLIFWRWLQFRAGSKRAVF